MKLSWPSELLIKLEVWPFNMGIYMNSLQLRDPLLCFDPTVTVINSCFRDLYVLSSSFSGMSRVVTSNQTHLEVSLIYKTPRHS